MARKLGELFYEVRGRTEGLQKDLQDSERQFGKLSAFVTANPVVAIGAVATAIGGIAVAATRMASQVEQSMRRVANVTRGTAGDLDALREEIARLSRESGRSQGDLAVAAEAAARNSESIVATGQRLRAGLQLAQVTGEDLTTTLDGLDGVLDLFGLASSEAGDAVAELFTAARGTAPVSELFALLQAGAPAIKQLGLDLPTAARAVLALSESGLSGKKAASELMAIAGAGAEGRAEIERLAATIPRAVDPVQELAGAYADVNSSAEVAASRIRQEFNAALTALGTQILPVVTGALNAFVALIDRLRGRASSEVLTRALAEIEQFGVAAAQTVNRASPTAPALDKVVTAIARLGEASRTGALDLASLTENQIKELRAQLEALAETPALDNRALGLGATKQQIQDLLTLLAKVPAAVAAADKPAATGGAEGRFSDRLAKEKAARDQAAKDLKAARDESARVAKEAEENARRAREAIVAALQDADRQLAELAGDTVSALNAEIAITAQRFTNLGASREEVTKLVAPLVAAREAAKGLNGAAARLEIPEQARKELGLVKREATETTSQTRTWADTVSDVADAALGVATAFSGANAELTRLLQGVAQLASSFAKLTDLASAAGGIGKLFSSGAGFASAIPAIGGVVGGIGTLVSAFSGSRDDPLVREQIENLKKNNQALADLRDGLLQLTLSASGASAAAVRRVSLFEDRAGPISDVTNEPTVISGPRDVRDILQDLRLAGVSLEELRKVAKDFEITLSESPTVEELRALQEQIAQFSLEKLLDTFDGAMKRLDVLAQVDPTRFGGLNGILKQVEVFLGPKGVPAIADALTGLDLTTAEGRAAAIAKLIGLVENIGALDLEAFGSLNPDEFLAAVVKLITGLQEIPDPVLAAAADFDTAFEALSTAFEAGALTADAFLAKVQDVLAEQFPDLLAQLDFSSVDAFRASVAQIIAAFAADGELTEAERAQIATLKDVEAAYLATTDAMLDQLDVLDRRFALNDESAVERFQQTFDALVAQFPELAQLLEGIDLTSAEGRDELKRRIRLFFEAAAVDGISEAERPFVDALAKLFGLVGDISAEALASLSERAKGILANAQRTIDVRGITDPLEIMILRMNALAEAFPELAGVFAQFNLATVEGRAAFSAFVESLLTNPEALAAIANQLGISVEDLIAMFGNLNGSIEATLPKIRTLGDAIREAFADADFEIALLGISDPLAQLTVRAKAAAKAVPAIAAALAGLDLSTAEGRKAAESALINLARTTADPAIREAILSILASIRAVIPEAATPDGAEASTTAREAITTAQSGVQQITERTGLSMVELLRVNNRQNDRMLALLGDGGDAAVGGAIAAAIAAARQALDALITRLPTLSPASLFARVAPGDLLRPPAAPTVGEGGVLVQIRAPITVNVFGPMSASEAQATGQTVGGAVSAYIEKTLGVSLTDIRIFRGGYPA